MSGMLAIMIEPDDDRVVLSFGQRVASIPLPTEKADAVARGLRTKARPAEEWVKAGGRRKTVNDVPTRMGVQGEIDAAGQLLVHLVFERPTSGESLPWEAAVRLAKEIEDAAMKVRYEMARRQAFNKGTWH